VIQSNESRYSVAAQFTAADGRLVMADRTPFRFSDREDNIIHQVTIGDTWWGLAERYYNDISERACGLWWVICDYQPQPIVDPTRTVTPGSELVIPSPVTVQNEILNVEWDRYL
jgi:nucleoid-associated protein YgaU